MMSSNSSSHHPHQHHHHHHDHHPVNHYAPSSSSSRSNFTLRDQTPGSAYRAGHLAPPDFLVPPPPASHTYDHRRQIERDEERGVSDAGRIVMPDEEAAAAAASSSSQQQQLILAAGQGDEPPNYFWTFDQDGRPVISRYTLSHPSPTSLPPAGNRGLKLRPLSSLDAHHPTRDIEPHRSRFRHCIDPTDPLVATHAPRWNAYGRLAPWTSGATGPLTGQGEEEVGPTGIAAGEEGEVGERRPRRGDRETNDRLRLRIAALQRAGVRSLLTSPPPRDNGAAAANAAGPSSSSSSGVKREREDSPLLLTSPTKRSALRQLSGGNDEDSDHHHHQPSSHRTAPPPPPPLRDPTTSSDDLLFTSSSHLAPTLLQPVLSPLQLLQSRTLRHTFRNPHIGALAKTTLDLGEAEGDVVKAVGGFWAALEEDNRGRYGLWRGGVPVSAKERHDEKRREREEMRKLQEEAEEAGGGRPAKRPRRGAKRAPLRTRTSFSPSAIGSMGAGGGNAAAAASEGVGAAVGKVSLDEVNPTFYKLEDLFVTRDGLPIPVQPPGQQEQQEGREGEEGMEEVGEQQQQQQQERQDRAQEAAGDQEDLAQQQQQGDELLVDGDTSMAAADKPAETMEAATASTQAAADQSAAKATAPAAEEVDDDKSNIIVQEGRGDGHNGVAAAPATEPLSDAPPANDGDAALGAAPPAAAPTAEEPKAGPSTPPPAPPAAAAAAAAPPSHPVSQAQHADPPPPQDLSHATTTTTTDPVPLTLPPTSQREILLASLSCLHDLSSDSEEYLARLAEVRGRLCEVKRKRDRIWRALREWAVERLEESEGGGGGGGEG